MKNSGLVAVGHILAMKDQKPRPEGHQKALRHFCSVLYCDELLSKDYLVDKSSGTWLFDKFMSDSRANVENFSKFLTGMLMKHGTDEQIFQQKVRYRYIGLSTLDMSLLKIS